MATTNRFEDIVESEREISFIGEIIAMIREQKRYWLAPIILVLIVLAGLVFLSGTALAPFIYTLF